MRARLVAKSCSEHLCLSLGAHLALAAHGDLPGVFSVTGAWYGA